MTLAYEAEQPPDDDPWSFSVGQCVSHKKQSLPSLVMGRIRPTKNIEIYGIRSFATKDDQRDRMMMSDSLTHVIPGSEPCQDCLLYNTGMCPGDLAKA